MTCDLISTSRAHDNLQNDSITYTDGETVTLSDLITAVSKAIAIFCRRDFCSTNYDEIYNGTGEKRLILKQYPIISVDSVASGPETVLKITNTDSAANQRATVLITSTGLTLIRVASGVTSTDATITFAAKVTLQALANAVNALGNGWSAAVIGSAAGDYGLWPSADLYIDSGMHGHLKARNEYAELKLYTQEISNYQVDSRGWLISSYWLKGINNYRVKYSAGYSTVPEDVQEACAQWVAALYWQSKRDPGLAQEATPGVTSRSVFSTMPPGAKELLLPYRKGSISKKGG